MAQMISAMISSMPRVARLRALAFAPLALALLAAPSSLAWEPIYMSDEVRDIDRTTRYFDGCKPACGWEGNVRKAMAKGPLFGCGPVKPGQDQDKSVSPNARSACSDDGESYACLDTSAFTEGGKRFAMAAISLDTTGGPYSCCECYEATFQEGPMQGENLYVQMINNGGFGMFPLMDLHVVGAGHGDNNIVAVNNQDPVPFGGDKGNSGSGNPAMFSEEDWGPQHGKWGQRFSYYNSDYDYGYAGGISSACGDQADCLGMCSNLPQPAVEMCKWEFEDEGFRRASIPSAKLRRVVCPRELHSRSGCLLEEDVVFGKIPLEEQDLPEPAGPKCVAISMNWNETVSQECCDELWPFNSDGSPQSYTCEDYQRWGYCNEPWMEGYCLVTCGGCPISTDNGNANQQPQPVAVMGCMNQAATNYNAQATQDDGSCTFAVPGCMDQGATNFNAGATQDDGSCEYAIAQESNGGCVDRIWETNYQGEPEQYVCADYERWGFCSEGWMQDWCDLSCGRCSPSSLNGNANQQPQPVAVMGCMNQAATNYNAQATQDDGSCTFAVPGCMDQGATNFNAGATQDDGSCEFPVLGCMNQAATNFKADATKDDGSCVYPEASQQGSTQLTAVSANNEKCTDEIWERRSNGEPEQYSCADYKRWGYCNESWMQNWCDLSCGRCECNDALWELNSDGLPEEYECSDYLGWGFCDRSWMQGWCNLTCGRCGVEAFG